MGGLPERSSGEDGCEGKAEVVSSGTLVKNVEVVEGAGEEMKRFKAVFCALFQHSHITDSCFGYHHCARCGTLLGDSLAGAYKADSNLQCGCRTCQDNYGSMGFVDKFMVPKPEWLGWSPEAWKRNYEQQRSDAMAAIRRKLQQDHAA